MAYQPSTSFAGRARWTLAIVFLLSVTGLAYEVVLTRLFSLIFQYHYVFLIVSTAIAGLSVGAAFAALALRKQAPTAVPWADLSAAALLLALLLAGSAVVISQLRSSLQTSVALAASFLPFVAIGYLNAALFAGFARQGGVLYAADLAGGAVGLVAALALVSVLGAYSAILALAVVAALAALLLAWIGGARAALGRTLVAAGLAIALLAANLAGDWIAFSPARLKDAPPDKTLLTVLKNDPKAKITETRWGPFARLDVVETSDEDVRYIFTDAGAGSTMVRFDGDYAAVSWLKREIAYLPFVVDRDNLHNVLILGAGAGKDVLMAHLAGADSITAVEINPTLVDLTREQASYNGSVFDLPGVDVHATDGRNYVERSDQHYDLIYANLVYSQAAAPGNSALAESYIFTREALQSYWDHLSENGRMGFVTHQGIEGIRLMIAALDMLRKDGMPLTEALTHVSLSSMQTGDAQTRTSVVLVTRQPWTGQTASAFADEGHARQAGMLYLPTYQEVGLDSIVSGLISLDDYIKVNADEFNYAPTTDDSPFFYQLTPGLPDQLSTLLIVAAGLTFVYLSWAMFFYIRRTQHWKRLSLTPYFALLGAAFLLIEIPLIQRFNLLLGQPVLALVVVTGTLLLGGGLGSLLSSRFPVELLPRLVPAAALLIALFAAGSLVLYPALIDWALPLSLSGRVLVTLVALLPLGLFMGVPFPSGLRLADRVDPQAVASFWGANAVTSVLASALAMALAINSGFSSALLLGAGLYALVALLALAVWPRLLAA